MTPEQALSATIAEVGPLLRDGTLSPVDLTEAALAALDGPGRALNAVVSLTAARARAAALTARDELAAGRYRGPLHGIPWGAKDLLATRDAPTTWGAAPLAEQRFDTDAVVIRRLEDAGAILVGKLAMIELAGGLGYDHAEASLTGPARDPWNRQCWTCGSSSGSGAAVAAGLLPFALGSETWGSIVCPSAFNGLSGFRPTFGVVPRTGAMALSWTLDKLGPMCRTAEDCATVLAAIAGPDPGDSSCLPTLPRPSALAPPALRIGVVAYPWATAGDARLAPVVAAAVEAMRAAGATVEEVALPAFPYEAVALVHLVSEAGAALGRLYRSGAVRALSEHNAITQFTGEKAISGADYVRASQVRRVIQREVDALFERFDVLVHPSMPYLASPIDEPLSASIPGPDPFGAAGNLCGLPALSVPCGFVDGLPVGLQFAGRPLADHAVLAAGRWFQTLTDWHTRRAPAVPA